MAPPPASPQTIAISLNPEVEQSRQLATEVGQVLEAKGRQVRQGGLSDPEFVRWLGSGQVDLLIALGGDGTMLKAGELGAGGGVPVLGINLGRVGFLIEVSRESWPSALDQVLAGDYWLERRLRLAVELERGGQRSDAGSALNEVVVGRGRTARPIRLQAEVDGRYLATYVADALICSSATGSTAYALAAGGPILPPEMRNLLLVPVAPHLSVDRAIVLAEGSAVRMELLSDEEADLSCDGQVRQALVVHDIIHVTSSQQDALFVRLQDPSYFFHNLKSYMNQVHMQGEE
jgi:NAD+ kinase